MAEIQFAFAVICTSIASTLFIEAISWLLVYRTPTYTRLRTELDRTSKKLDKTKAAPTLASSKDKAARKEKRLEETMKTTTRDLTASKVKTGIITAVLLFILYHVLNTLLEGVVVAKLPFEPIPLMRRVTHYNLQGDNWTDGSAAFIYVLCSVGIRGNLQKALGMGLPRKLNKLGSIESYMDKFK